MSVTAFLLMIMTWFGVVAVLLAAAAGFIGIGEDRAKTLGGKMSCRFAFYLVSVGAVVAGFWFSALIARGSW